MTLKEIQEHFKVIKSSGCYALYDENEAFYKNYRGCAVYPFVGCIKRRGNHFIFVYEGIKHEEKLCKSITDLNNCVSDYISKCNSYGITTDCFNVTYNTSFKCEIAVIQFIRNNTELKLNKNTIKVGSTIIRINSEEGQLCICIDNGVNMFMKHLFTDVFEVLSYIKSLLKTLLLLELPEPITSLRKIAAVDVQERYDLFDNDILYQADLSTFKVEQIGTLKEQLINELEGILQQLKH